MNNTYQNPFENQSNIGNYVQVNVPANETITKQEADKLHLKSQRNRLLIGGIGSLILFAIGGYVMKEGLEQYNLQHITLSGVSFAFSIGIALGTMINLYNSEKKYKEDPAKYIKKSYNKHLIN